MAWWSGRVDGDQRTVSGDTLPAVVAPGRSLYRLRQVHGSDVVVVGADPPPATTRWMTTPAGSAPEADAVVAVGTRSCVAVLTADCAPVALGSPEGIHAAVHVGWRGLLAGVVARAVGAMAALGATEVVAGLGPTIHPCCYAFSPADLDVVAAAVGDGARAHTAAGAPALDLPGAVRSRLEAAGARLVVDVDRCTACGGDAFSHRGHGDEARQAVFVWDAAEVPGR